MIRRGWAWWCSAPVQSLVWPSLALNAAYHFLPPVRRVLPDPMYLVHAVSHGTWLLGN